MKFLKLDKKKGAGTPEIKGKFAYLVAIGDIATFPNIDEKGVRLLGNITFKPDCGMIPIYLSSTSQEFSYDVIGEDDEKSYKVKFMGTHPGTELEAMEFAKNQIEQPYLVLIPGCNLEEPWKLLGEITNPLIFTSTHKASRENSKFTFTFEQRIGSEFIYFSYGGVVIAPEVPGPNVPLNGFWAKVDASNIDPFIQQWRAKLNSPDTSDFAKSNADNIDPYLQIWRQKIDANYVHDQALPNSIWTINHPLNKKVSVTIIDTSGNVVEGKVTINNGNKVVIEFNFPFSGEAILN